MTNKDGNNSGTKKSIILLISLVLVILLAAVLASSLSSLPAQDGGSDDNNAVAVGIEEAGFPKDLVGSEIVDIGLSDSRLFVLTHSSLYSLDKGGQSHGSFEHKMESPVIKFSENRCLVYDKSGSKYAVYGSEGEIYSGEISNAITILTGYVSNSGAAAIAFRTGSSASTLICFNSDGEKTYEWSCGSEYITCAAVSSNEKYALCCAVSSEGGEFYTNCYFIDVFSSENPPSYKVDTVAPLGCFIDQTAAIVTFADRRLRFDTNDFAAEPQETSLGASAVMYAADSRGNTAIITAVTGSAVHNLSVYDKKNNLSYTAQLDEKPQDICLFREKAAVICSGKAVRYNTRGSAEDEFDLSASMQLICTDLSSIFTVSGTKLFLIN